MTTSTIDERRVAWDDIPTLKEFYERGEYLSWGDWMLLSQYPDITYSEDGVGFKACSKLLCARDDWNDLYDLHKIKFSDTDEVHFIILNVKSREIILINGDINAGLIADEARYAFAEHSTTSFACLTELIGAEACKVYNMPCNNTYEYEYMMSAISHAIACGDMRIHDIVNDDTLSLSSTEKKAINKARKVFNNNNNTYTGDWAYSPSQLEEITKDAKITPKKGYTLIVNTEFGIGKGFVWHRPSTMLFSFMDKTYLVGQDEGTFFGCELADHPKTITQAYKGLIPQEIRNCRNLSRQGEWFLKPIRKSQLPTINDILAYSTNIDLPLDSIDSNPHTLHGYVAITSDGIYVSNDSLFNDDSMDIELEHSDHDPVCFAIKTYEKNVKHKCFKIYKNTAVRSVSVDGVD